MKALVLEKYNRLVYKDVPDPDIQDDEVLVRVKACGICGSDVHGMDGSSGRRIPPLIMGHEASGVIVKRGAKVTDWGIGDRVTFDSTIYRLDDWYSRRGLYNLSDGRMVLGVSTEGYHRDGAFAEFVALPHHILYKIPDTVSFTQAAMAEPAAVALHAVQITPLSVNDTAVVVGAGMIGLFLIQLLRLAGCGQVIAIDVDRNKLHLAEKLGADVVFSASIEVPTRIRELTEKRGADVAFEAVGKEQTVYMAIDCVRRGASVTLIGNLSPSIKLPLQKIVARQLRLQGSCAICGEYPAVLDMMAKGKIKTDVILSAEVPLSEGAEWFQRLYNNEKGLMKVVLLP